MSNFHPLAVVDRGSEARLQVFKITGRSRIFLKPGFTDNHIHQVWTGATSVNVGSAPDYYSFRLASPG